MIVFAVFERVADFLADGRAAGFAVRPDAMAERAQMFGERGDLRGFTAAFRAFERDE